MRKFSHESEFPQSDLNDLDSEIGKNQVRSYKLSK